MDNTGKEHNWRDDLVAALAKRQDANGSWVNRDDRFMEGDPNIVTSYAAKRPAEFSASIISSSLGLACTTTRARSVFCRPRWSSPFKGFRCRGVEIELEHTPRGSLRFMQQGSVYNAINYTNKTSDPT